jgi:hypothetical protein
MVSIAAVTKTRMCERGSRPLRRRPKPELLLSILEPATEEQHRMFNKAFFLAFYSSARLLGYFLSGRFRRPDGLNCRMAREFLA